MARIGWRIVVIAGIALGVAQIAACGEISEPRRTGRATQAEVLELVLGGTLGVTRVAGLIRDADRGLGRIDRGV
ncbi:hypothetical protein ACFO8O_15185 [Hephaestia sp. GCM10023244]|uniref:hypothetical protein n=1 Tax=unclassified Hephaestia TaxID=2631281 RepID=UPI0020775E7D|nr:hypothetical protein [Hephaestia sp. MAHUQ-44]MCM8732306.1 hypothetical protein [Hephaestia sp. MAHUQ-44]